MLKSLRSSCVQAIFLLCVSVLAYATDAPQPSGPVKPLYQKPPKVITDILESPAPPMTLVSPARDRVLVIASMRHPPISDLAQPMLRLAGLRINPATNGRHHPPRGATCSKASHRMPAGNGKRIQLKYKGPALASWP